MTKVIYVNHKSQQCGVYEFGKEIGLLLQTSIKFNITYIECDSFSELEVYFKTIQPDIVLYNYHPSTMAWILSPGKYFPHKTHNLDAIHIGTIHEVYQELADYSNDEIFDFHVAPDPTLLLKNPLVYKTGRLLPEKVKEKDVYHKVPIIGSFGFATPNKGFERIIELVQNEFDEAVINLNIPFAKFGDSDGENARKIAHDCRKLINKENIILNIDHSYLEKDDLISFLAGNTINVFLYDEVIKRGISSATDWALTSGRPLAISKSSLFRHLHNCNPSICVADNNLKTIIANGVKPIRKFYSEYSSENLLWDYERILSDVLEKAKNNAFKKKSLIKFYKEKVKGKLGRSSQQKVESNGWVQPNYDTDYTGGIKTTASYQPVDINGNKLNRILDNDARKIYQPAVDLFTEHFPNLIKKKIAEANVQQAFVFDTSVNFSQQFSNPKILAVGAFEDTAAEGLRLLNFEIDFIDPILNYDIETFISKPNVKEASYDIIISTSVIEHVEKDEKFIQDIAYLLKKDGYGILTCDYKDQYKKGDHIPEVDYRFYTQHDLKERLMKAVPNCRLVDEPEWECENPDFFFLGIFNYTFASIVFKKI
jgi:SAM-dependent methyltransferase